MKKVLLLLGATLLMLVGCKQKNEDKAKLLIEKYIKDNSDNPKSYESISFSDLDSVFSSDEMIEKLLIDSITYSKNRFNFSNYGFLNQSDFDKHVDSVNNSLKILRGFNQESFIGFKMIHKFRLNNKFGAKQLNEFTFNFNKNLDEIIFK